MPPRNALNFCLLTRQKYKSEKRRSQTLDQRVDYKISILTEKSNGFLSRLGLCMDYIFKSQKISMQAVSLDDRKGSMKISFVNMECNRFFLSMYIRFENFGLIDVS